MTIKTIFQVTRVHEPLRVDVDVQAGKVVNAWVSGRLFRGFENMLFGREPRDAALYTQRICGICSCAHAVAASLAQRQAFGVESTPNGQHLTNLIFAADIIQNHLRHFYLLVLYDYCIGPDMPPYTPRLKGDFRLPQKTNDGLLKHAKDALMLAARAHEMMAVFGAKAPHQQTIMATGVTEKASAENISAYRSILQEVSEWITEIHLADVMTIADYYKDYYNIGAGYGNFLSCGMFAAPVTNEYAFVPGIVMNRGKVDALDVDRINEEIRYSWYRDDQIARHPVEGLTVPDRNKPDAYTWLKAPRYQDQPFEGGPLARGWVNGEYRKGVSVMDRIVARAQELQKICRLAEGWLDKLLPGGPSLLPYTPARNGKGIGLTDAMRGPLGHWLEVKENKVSHYQVVTPTTWNFSPRDSRDMPGPVEKALIGVMISDPDSLIEVGRVVRSFDPCFSCAIHILEADPGKIKLV